MSLMTRPFVRDRARERLDYAICDSRAQPYRLARFAGSRSNRFHGVENIPSDGAGIITPNHVTYADPIWITIPIRRWIYDMARDKPFRIPVLGQMMRIFGAFPVNLDIAADASAQREAIELLQKGWVFSSCSPKAVAPEQAS